MLSCRYPAETIMLPLHVMQQLVLVLVPLQLLAPMLIENAVTGAAGSCLLCRGYASAASRKRAGGGTSGSGTSTGRPKGSK